MTAGESGAGLPVPAAEQMTASQPMTSAWVSASAGSGKTSVLIDRIVRLLLTGGREETGVSPERLLCVTFTNAAAAEMRNRLFGRLGRWAVIPDEELDRELSALGCMADDVDTDTRAARRRRARLLFARALETPGGLKIQTIHGFCDRLLRQFPLEAGVAVNFRILDERAEQALRRQAREEVLQRALYAGKEDALGDAVREISLHVDDNGFTRLLEKTAMVTASSNVLHRLLSPGGMEEAIAAIYKSLEAPMNETAESVGEALRPDREEKEKWMEVSRALSNGGGKLDQAAALAIWNFFNLPPGNVESWLDVFFTKSMTPRKKLAVKRVADGQPGIYRHLTGEQERLAHLLKRRRALIVAQRSAALLKVMQAQAAAYEALKRRQGYLDYNDLIDRAGALLTQSQAAPWVLYKLDGGLDHILVDEAQDTSPGQWRVIRSLATEFFSGAGARDAERTFFAVGDEKQSIFSFQGADLNEFAAMLESFGKDVTGAHKAWAHVRLDRSWRSTPEILKAVDRVFADHAGSLSLSAPSVTHKPVRGESGVVELWPPETPPAAPPKTPEESDGEETTDADPWDAPLDYIPADSPRACLARRIADQIGGWLATGERLSSGAVITPGDVMILVRRRDALVTEMVRALKSAGIPVAGADRMVLMEQLAAQDLMALGRFALLPDDDLTLASVLKGPLCGLDDEKLFSLAHDRSGSLWRALRGSRDFAPVSKFLSDVRRRARWQTPFAFYAGILAGGGRRNLLARLGVEAEEVIDEFVTLAMDYERLNTPGLEGFLHWLSTDEVQLKRDADQGRDEVRILTVHAAKGLESPVVFLPDTCAVPSSRRYESPLLPLGGESGGHSGGVLAWTTGVEGLASVDDSRERAEKARHDENLRLFYVAMTRARDRLYICGHHGKLGMAEGCWHELASQALTPVMTDHDTDHGPVRRLAGAAAAEIAPPDRAPSPVAPLPAWAHTPAPAMPVARIIVPSRLGTPSRSGSGAAGNAAAAARGVVIHRLLEILPDCAPSRRAERARAFLQTAAPMLEEAEKESVMARVMAVLNAPDCARLFGPGSRGEVPVAGRVIRGGEESAWDIHGRIDRLVRGEEILAVDYKSTRSPPKTVAAVGKGDMAQMAAYRAVLREIWPDRPVHCGLLWVEDARLMILPKAALDDSLTRQAQTR